MAQAREIADPEKGAAGVLLEFEWEGMQWRPYAGTRGRTTAPLKIYERTMQYQEGRLIGRRDPGVGPHFQDQVRL